MTAQQFEASDFDISRFTKKGFSVYLGDKMRIKDTKVYSHQTKDHIVMKGSFVLQTHRNILGVFSFWKDEAIIYKEVCGGIITPAVVYSLLLTHED